MADALEQAIEHHEAGRLEQAEKLYRQLLSENPDDADALHLLGLLLGQRGENESAEQMIARAISIDTQVPEFFSSYAEISRRNGKSEQAVSALSSAAHLAPDSPDIWTNLGFAQHKLGRIDDAARSFRKVTELDSNSANAWLALAACLRELLKFDEAIDAYRKALSLNSSNAKAQNNLANLFKFTGKLNEAMDHYSKAIALKPEFAEAHNNLATALRDVGRYDEALAASKRAIAIRPDFSDAYSNLGYCLKELWQLDAAIAAFAKAVELNPTNAVADSDHFFLMHYHPAYDAKALFAESLKWAERHARPLRNQIRPHDNDPSPTRRLRIGYVSPDFRRHAVGKMIVLLIAHHDHQQFEIFSYSDALHPDDITQLFKDHSDQWRDTANMSDEQLAGQIRADQIDILVDLAAHTAGNRLLVFARKPAPIQVTLFPSTTGLETLDYRLTDPYLDRPGAANEPYTEKSIHLKTLWCYKPTGLPEVNPLPALSTGHITFGSLNNIAKINPTVIHLWIKILQHVPNSHLILKSNPGSHLGEIRKLFTSAGIAPERLTIVNKLPDEQFYALYNQMDVGLDPFPYTGHTTTLDSLWMGVPVITIAGATCIGRAGVSILSNLGMPELIASTPDEYVALAVKTAKDLPKLVELRAGLRARMRASCFMDAPAYAKDFESTYRTIWTRKS